MKKLILSAILLFLIIYPASADEFFVPFSCWEKDLQKAYAETGRKLDTVTDARTKESWGYITNKGSGYIILTYKASTPDDLEIIMQIANKIELIKRKE